MKRLIQKPFNPEDAMSLVGKSSEKTSDIELASFEILGHQSIAQTWWYEDTVIGCGGVILSDPPEAWSIVNEKTANDFKRELLVGSKRFLEQTAKDNNIEYMRASWQVNFSPEIHWLEHLGFEKEDEVIEINDMKSYVYSRRFKWESL